MKCAVWMLAFVALTGCAKVAVENDPAPAREVAEADNDAGADQLVDYRLAAKAAGAMNYLAPIRMQMAEQLSVRGELPRFLSDMGILYPEANVHRDIRQVRLADEGARVIALLEPEGESWVGFRIELLDSFPYQNWVCELNFRVPGESLPACDYVDRRFAEMSPSFDCTSAETRSEKAICRHDRLMVADQRMNRAYRTLQELAPESERPRHRLEQIAWLQNRGGDCDSDRGYSECLDKVIRNRTSSLYSELAAIERTRR